MSANSDEVSASLLDARGLFCPEPVMMLHKKVREINVGECIKVLATDPSTQRDIPKFCQFLGHELLELEVKGEPENGKEERFVFVIRKVEKSDTN